MSMNDWNISNEIQEFALDKGLDRLATGGGCDFIVHIWDDGIIAVLHESDSGETPERLDDCGVPVDVVIYDDENDWSFEVNKKTFASAKEAIEFMHIWTESAPQATNGGEQ
tara:strand:- start:318 stop:650 length:333 start_codon:yes stop_codon:yes gene_type:complete